MKPTRIQVSTLMKGFSLLMKSFTLPNHQTLFYWTTKKQFRSRKKSFWETTKPLPKPKRLYQKCYVLNQKKKDLKNLFKFIMAGDYLLYTQDRIRYYMCMLIESYHCVLWAKLFSNQEHVKFSFCIVRLSRDFSSLTN